MKKLTHSYDFFTSEVDGIDIFFRRWLPEKEVQRLFIIQHGIGEHGGRYGNLIKALHNETGSPIGITISKTKKERP